MEIENYKIKDAPSEPDINLIIASKVKAHPYIGKKKAKDIFKMSFDDVELIKDKFKNFFPDTPFELLELVYDVKRSQLENLGIIEFFRAFNHIKDMYNQIIKAERRISKEPSEKLKAAGIENLNVLGSGSILLDIGERFGFKPSDVGKWEYGEVYYIMLSDKLKLEVKENLK